MHHPVGLDALRSSTFVEDEGLLQPYAHGPFRRVDWPVGPSGFPKPSSGYPVRPRAVPVFPVPRAVEVPLFLSCSRQLFMSKNKIKLKTRISLFLKA